MHRKIFLPAHSNDHYNSGGITIRKQEKFNKKINTMSKEKEGKQKSGKTAPSATPKEKKAAKKAKREAKNKAEQQ